MSNKKKRLIHIALCLSSLLLGILIGYLAHPKPTRSSTMQTGHLLTAIQDEQEEYNSLKSKEFSTAGEVHKELARIKKKQTLPMPFIPAKGPFAQERNQMIILLAETYYFILNTEKAMMLSFLEYIAFKKKMALFYKGLLAVTALLVPLIAILISKRIIKG